MNCPKCKIEKMVQEVFSGVEVDKCPSCKGMFLDQGELKSMLSKNTGNTADSLQFSSTSDHMDDLSATCGRCNVEMKRYRGPGKIRLEKCDQCQGVFLDQGELATLQLYYKP